MNWGICLIRSRLALYLVVIGLVGLLVACSSEATPATPTAAVTPAASPTASPTNTPIPLKLLNIEPVTGYIGDPFTVTGEGLTPNKEVELVWATVDGSYVNQASAESVLFHERKFVEKRVSLGSATTDAQGRFSATVTAPEDYGEVHDIYAIVDGKDAARGGFRILRTATITPTKGPVGTPITITVKGISVKSYENTMALRYDNKYTGFVTAVTTRGTAIFQIRAAGPPGQHTIQVSGASPGTPYLNLQQSPVAHVPMDFKWVFTVTEDNGPPPDSLEWPDMDHTALASEAIPRTTAGSVLAAPGASAALEPASGPILSQATLYANGLPSNTEVELFWVTARGNRLSPSGWGLYETSLLKTSPAQDGSLTASFQVPDGLGGWHVVRVAQGDKVLAEAPYFVERSLVGVTPKRVKAGEIFTVQVKGIGWTELDNGVAVTYDNAYIGYACGFNSNGDVTITLVATGGPGTHLIDLYPMIYHGGRSISQAKELWNYEIPFLTFVQDFPGLELGYALPAFRLAIEVVE